MFSNLSDSLDNVFRKLKGQGKITEKNISDALRQVRMALLEADVDYGVTKGFIAAVKEKALGVEVMKSVKPGATNREDLSRRIDRTTGWRCRTSRSQSPQHAS